MFSTFNFFRKKPVDQSNQSEQLQKIQEQINNTSKESAPCTAMVLRLLRFRVAGYVPQDVVELYKQQHQKINQEMNGAVSHDTKFACEVIEKNFSDYGHYTVGLAVKGAMLEIGKEGAEETVQLGITNLDEATTKMQRCQRLFPSSSKESQLKEAHQWQKNLSELIDLHQKCRRSRGSSK